MKMKLLGQPLKKRTNEKEIEGARTWSSCNVRHNKKRRTHQLATNVVRGREFVVSAEFCTGLKEASFLVRPFDGNRNVHAKENAQRSQTNHRAAYQNKLSCSAPNANEATFYYIIVFCYTSFSSSATYFCGTSVTDAVRGYCMCVTSVREQLK